MTSQGTLAPTLQIQIWHIDRLVLYARNPRKNDAAVDRMCASIREFGFKVPVLARSSGELVDGHLRLKAARKLGSWPGGDITTIPVILCDEWTPQQVKAFRLMVNRSVTWADWDEELFSLELQELNAEDFDLSLTGFDPREIDTLLATPDDDERADAAPPLPENPVSRPGDLWLCGSRRNQHRVLCADATEPVAVSRLLVPTSGLLTPLLMVTDPPYGVDYHPEWRAEAGVNDNPSKMGRVSNDDRVDWREAYQLFPGDVVYVWHAGRHSAVVQQSIEACGFEIRCQIIWAKDRFALSRGHYHWQHEPCWYAVRNQGHWTGDRSQSTLWNVKSREDDGHGHSAQKPVEVMRRPILNHTARGGAVYDPFLGTGTTLIAAELTERVCYGLELDPKYVDVVVKRWQELSGQKAKIDGDGRTFDEIAAERLRTAS